MFKNIIKIWQRKKLLDKRFDFLFNEPPQDEYISLDCETTGLNPKKDEILSIGAVLIKDNKILMRKTFNIFVKPSQNINPESIKIHLLREIDLLQQNKPLSNEIDTNSLGKIERDLLKESFKIVNDFKKIVSYIFKLDKIY